MNRTHTTEPAESGAYHYWEVRGERGAVSLHLLHSRHPGFVPLRRSSPMLAAGLAETDGGHWVFDVLQSHVPNAPESGWSCPTHGDTCDMDAFVSRVADPVWQRLRTTGITDAAVFAELERLHAEEFEAAP